jgi:hypothetical protein
LEDGIPGEMTEKMLEMADEAGEPFPFLCVKVE